jgi:hypothetical protein
LKGLFQNEVPIVHLRVNYVPDPGAGVFGCVRVHAAVQTIQVGNVMIERRKYKLIEDEEYRRGIHFSMPFEVKFALSVGAFLIVIIVACVYKIYQLGGGW